MKKNVHICLNSIPMTLKKKNHLQDIFFKNQLMQRIPVYKSETKHKTASSLQ